MTSVASFCGELPEAVNKPIVGLGSIWLVRPSPEADRLGLYIIPFLWDFYTVDWPYGGLTWTKCAQIRGNVARTIHIWPEHGYAAADIFHAQSLPMESGLVALDPFEMWRATLTPRQIQKCVDTSLQPNVVLRAGQNEIDTR